jgi:hypothetical protein
MKNLVLSLAIVFTIGVGMAFTRTGAQRMKGYIDDSMCASTKTPMCTPETRVKCATKCIANGAAAVFVSGEKVYKISNQKDVLDYAGKNVEVDATINNDTVEVTKIIEVK